MEKALLGRGVHFLTSLIGWMHHQKVIMRELRVELQDSPGPLFFCLRMKLVFSVAACLDTQPCGELRQAP